MFRQQQRSRQRLLWAIGLFLAAQLFVGGLFDYAWPLLRSRRMCEVFTKLDQRATAPEIVILGSSRLMGDLDEDELGKCLTRRSRSSRQITAHNAAVEGGDTLLAEHLLREHLRVGVRPTMVILEMSPEFMNWFNMAYQLNTLRLLRWEHVPMHLIDAARSQQFLRLVQARFVPLYAHREFLWSLANERITQGSISHTFTPTPRRFQESPLVAEVTAEEELAPLPPLSQATIDLINHESAFFHRHHLKRFAVSHHQRRALHSIVDLCEQEQMQLILLLPPVTAAQRRGYTGPVDGQFLSFLHEATQDRPCVRILDARDWLPDAAFVDNHHVNQNGAQHFTRRFVEHVLAPTWPKGTTMAGSEQERPLD
jgi:hypothetical protein